jgi:hypothetical protein
MRGRGRRAPARTLVWSCLGLWVCLGGCGGTGEEDPPAAGAGTYVVVADSSRVHFVFQRDGEATVGSFSRVLGSLTLREGPRGFLDGEGRLTVDLASATLDDSLQARALVADFFQADADREFRTAELTVRELAGRSFTIRLPPGGVTPISGHAQLVMHRMVVSRRFEGEISRTASGYRITTAAPVSFSIEGLGMAEELEAWRAAAGVASVGDGVGVTVDLRLARRDSPAAAKGAGS